MADQSTNFTASNGEYRNPFYQGTFEDETTEQMERRLHWAAAAVEAERVVQNNKTAPQPTSVVPYEALFAAVMNTAEQAMDYVQNNPDKFGARLGDDKLAVVCREFLKAQQPAEQQPVSWIRIRGDHVILSRCDWMYPASTEDSAGPRDEQRFAAVGRRDGDIVLPAPEGALDREDLKTMLTWPNVSKPTEQQPQPTADKFVATFRCESNGMVGSTNAPIHSVNMHDDGVVEVVIDHWPEKPAPDVAALVEALQRAVNCLEISGLYSSEAAIHGRATLAAHREQHGD